MLCLGKSPYLKKGLLFYAIFRHLIQVLTRCEELLILNYIFLLIAHHNDVTTICSDNQKRQLNNALLARGQKGGIYLRYKLYFCCCDEFIDQSL